MSDHRKKLSGAEYRKRKAAREFAAQSQKGALHKFVKFEESAKYNKVEQEQDVQSTTEKDNSGCSNKTFSDPNVIPTHLSDTVTIGTLCLTTTTMSSSSQSESVIADSCSLLECKSNTDVSSYVNISEICNDPGKWPTVITDKLRQEIVKRGPPENLNHDYPFPLNLKGRKFSVNYYKRTLCNGETAHRTWLVYSLDKNSIFCFCCKLFLSTNMALTTDGYSDWGHMASYLSEHEKSKNHLDCHKKWVELSSRLKSHKTIDQENQKIVEAETRHWRSVLERLIAIVHFLGQQCLPFRGTKEVLYHHNNGNFLKLVELIAKFDDVMSDHLMRLAKASQPRQTHYLSKDIQNELISLLSNAIKSQIMSMLKEAKYYSIIVDCTPDVSHVEQMSLTIRFVNCEPGSIKIQEHFIGFVPLEKTTGAALTERILNLLSIMNIPLENMRGQGYDNGSNMKGKNVGVQKRILELNSRAFFIPCTSHSLNLVVNDAAEASTIGVAFFDTLQKLYVFFSASTHRWGILKGHISSLTLKPLSETRWEARIDAIRPLRYYIKDFNDALLHIADDTSFDRKTRYEAECLLRKIVEFRFLCCLVIWHDILNEINILSKMLQKITVELATAITALQKVTKHMKSLRNEETFNSFLVEAKTIAESIGAEAELQNDFPCVRLKRPKKQFDESDEVVRLDPKNDFKVNFYFFTLDQTIASLEERFEQINQHSNNFEFLYNIPKLKFLSKNDLENKCKLLQDILSDGDTRDVDSNELVDELRVLCHIVEDNASPLDILKYTIVNNFAPNVSIALRILLTLPITVASGERSFSKLKLIKTYLRSTMSETRLDDLAMISIEHELGEKLNYSDLIKDFATVKARKISL